LTDGQRDRGGARQGRQLPRFDPVAGMRAMADIQAEGLRAAGELLERVLRAEPNGRPMSPREPVGDYTAVVDAWVDLMRRMVAGFTQPVEPGAVTVPVDSSGVGPPIRLSTSDGGGSEASTEVWLHNGTFSSIGPLTMRCGPLTAPDGTSLENAEVTFAPRHVPALEARSSRGIVVSLAIEGSPAKGSYRGAIQADGASRLWLPIEVVI
jgi:hypothetical protein